MCMTSSRSNAERRKIPSYLLKNLNKLFSKMGKYEKRLARNHELQYINNGLHVHIDKSVLCAIIVSCRQAVVSLS